MLYSCWEDLHLVITEIKVDVGCRIMIWFSELFAWRVFRPMTLLFQVMWHRFQFTRMKREDPSFVCRQLISVLGWLLLGGVRSIQCRCSVLLLSILEL